MAQKELLKIKKFLHFPHKKIIPAHNIQLALKVYIRLIFQEPQNMRHILYKCPTTHLHGMQTENITVNKLQEVMNDVHYKPKT
jgi:hypothetical protein